uniref:Uncharacterized protein n=1 Tax=Phytophthora ramorum TaxID=164328 RepID=H3GCU3_PHYRM
MAPSFQGTAWLLVEPKSTFYSPRYSQESLSVRLQLLPFWNEPQTILQLGQTEFLVLNGSPQDAAKRSGDPKETKKLLQLTVRPLDDVRRAQLYQTAARAQLLELFVDVEHTRQRLLRCLSEQEEKDPSKKLLDEAFAALERAQQSGDRETALQLYREAERGFYEAEQVLPDGRSRELLRVRRGDLQRTIRGLERREEERPGAIQQTLPAPRVVEVATAPPAMDISARLEELQRFAAEQESTRMPQENTTDLAARLAVLKNEKVGPAPLVDDLAERLRRLRGGNGPAAAFGEKVVDRKSAVDSIIEQVTDEIALGIEDEEIDVDEELDSDSVRSSKSASSKSSESSKSSQGSAEISGTKKK